MWGRPPYLKIWRLLDASISFDLFNNQAFTHRGKHFSLFISLCLCHTTINYNDINYFQCNVATIVYLYFYSRRVSFVHMMKICRGLRVVNSNMQLDK